MADDDQQYGLQAVDHDPFAVDPMAEPAAISLPPDQPAPSPAPEATPSPLKADLRSWDDWGAVGGMVKAGKLLDAPLSAPSLPTREQWQAGEQAVGHGIEHVATLPMRIADKLGLLEAPTATETPGQVSESDVEKEQARAAAEGTFGASTALQMVLGGPGAAEEGAAGVAGGVLRQPTFEENPARVDQRLPRTKKPIEGDDGAKNVDTDSMRLTPKLYENNVGLVRNYPGVKIPPRASTDAAADAFVNHVSDNLQWLYDQVPDDIKFRSAQWYDGGNKIVKDWAQQYGVPESTTAGVIAATSPQKDWFNNVSIAKRILDQMRGDPNFYKTQKMTPEMEQFFRDTPSLNKPENQPIVDEIRGKSLADIDRIMPYPKDERDIYKAMWIRLYDQAHTDPSYPLITPEGTFGPKVTTKYSSEPTSVAWGSLPEIAKAVNVVDANGNQSVLANTIGMRHKVRNFYNNLISPNSAAGDVTVDTHAVAAGLLRPVSANSTEVAHNFGNWPGKDLPAAKNSAKTGIFGTYPLYADAYRKAAEQLGILPRQLQSVTWEAVRGLFPEDWKSAKNSAIIDNIWRQYRAGKETLDGARQRILNTTGGIQPPSWYRPARANNAPTQGAGNAPELFEPRVYGPGSQPSFTGTGRGTAGGASAPVVRPSPRDLAYEFDFGAGAPYNEQFPGWSGLSGDQKATISKAMLDKIADHAKEVTGANEYARLSGLGGWHEFTNPSYKSRLVATPEVAGDFADTMGYLAQQTKIMGYRPDPAGDRLGLALYGDGLGDEKKLAAFWRDVNDKYPDFSSGFSPSRNQRGQPGIEMLFDKNEPGMADRVKSELIPGLQRLADDHAIGKVDSGIFRATEESREHDWQKDPTGGDYTSRLLARHGPDLLKRLELFKRQELEPALQQHIDAAQGASPGRGGDRGTGIQETQGAPSLPFRAAASPVTLGSGITDKRTAPLRLPIWWHGSASGDLRGGQSGLHLGTKLAATQALESRIGTPADGMGWTGDTEYGKRLLAGTKTLNKMGPYNETGIRAGSRDIDYPEEDHYAGDYFKQNPSEHPKYPDGTKMPLDVKPSVEPYYITGSMNNHPGAPYGDWKANGYMKGALKRGTARNGYYYENQGEDSGSISAVVPNGDHVKAAPGHSIYNDTTLGSGVTDERTAAVRAAAAAAGGRPNLIGLPTDNITLAGKPFVPGPVGALHDIAEKYMSDAGLPYDPPKTWVPVDKGRATKIAQAFEDMKHAPDDPQVKASYDAMANETVAQFKALKDSGIKFEFIKPGMDDPYAENPRAAAKDVIENKHLWVFPTEGGFGSGSEAATAAMKNNPLLRPSGEKIEGKEVPVNDLFRIVHDVFGHLKDGNGFRASGEENAWRSHSAMYSDAARPAMTSETRGQNSYVNYGPNGEFNRKASAADTKYADQKIGLLPKWAVDEGRKDITAYHGSPHDFDKFDASKIGTGEGAQAYGHGLYFAENPETAKAYKNALAGDHYTIDGNDVGKRPVASEFNSDTASKHPDAMAAYFLTQSRSPTKEGRYADALSALDINDQMFAKYQRGLNPDASAAVRKAITRNKDAEIGTGQSGKTYEVNIKADPSQFLDWDKPLSEQHPKVQEFIRQRAAAMPLDEPGPRRAGKHILQSLIDNDAMGNDLYGRLAYAPGSQSQWSGATNFIRQDDIASQQLRDAGIPGIKYLDEGSRDWRMLSPKESTSGKWVVGKWPGGGKEQRYFDNAKDAEAYLAANKTSNYVVFDDNLIHTIKKNGVDQLVKNNASHFQTQPVEGDPFVEKKAGGGNIGHVQSTIAPLAQALDQAVPNFDPEALGFRPSTNIEDVRDKPEWQRTIETITRKPMFGGDDDPFGATQRAHGGRVEPKNINHAPTEAQKEAGNYAKDHLHIQGLPITIENAKGKTRRGVGRGGKPWEVTMPAHYGYIKQTEGSDGDHVDVYVGPHIRSPHVYVIDQVDADTKKWDEHKIMLGFGSEAQAVNIYKRGFSDGKGANRIGTITGMTVAQFREWLKHGDHGKPFRHAVDRKDRVRDILHRHGIQNGVTP